MQSFAVVSIPLLVALIATTSTYGAPIAHRATGVVKFYLYTRANPTTPQELIIENAKSVKDSHFEAQLQTKIIIHGWANSYQTTPNPELIAAYLSQGANYNLIAVDWSDYAKLNYLSSRAKVPIVGEDIAELIDYLHVEVGLSYKRLVVIGHSLGAHVAGYTGKYVKNGKIAAIVGLDPAYPLYSYDNAETRLDSTDAEYVQTIQTNGNVKGFLKPIGIAAFYPNWGRLQPGCGTDLDGTCSHKRSVLLYAEALRGYTFNVERCDSYQNILDKTGCSFAVKNVDIGDPMQINQVNGIFYFKTKDEEPFGN